MKIEVYEQDRTCQVCNDEANGDVQFCHKCQIYGCQWCREFECQWHDKKEDGT